MKYLLTVLCVAVTVSAMAQVSVGMRLVANRHFSAHNAINGPAGTQPKSHIGWDKDLAGRYTARNWAFELSLNHQKDQSLTKYSGGGQYLSTEYSYTRYYTENQFQFSTVVQYNVWGMGKNKLLRNYVGLSIDPLYIHYKKRNTSENNKGVTLYDETYKSEDLNILPGLRYSLCYDAGKHLQVLGTAFLRYNPHAAAFTPATIGALDAQFGFGLGVSYKITP